MPVVMSKKSGLAFFEAISPWAKSTASDLENAGVTLEVQFHALKAISSAGTKVAPLPCNTSAVMKGLPPWEKSKVVSIVEHFLVAVSASIGKQVTAPSPKPTVQQQETWQPTSSYVSTPSSMGAGVDSVKGFGKTATMVFDENGKAKLVEDLSVDSVVIDGNKIVASSISKDSTIHGVMVTNPVTVDTLKNILKLAASVDTTIVAEAIKDYVPAAPVSTASGPTPKVQKGAAALPVHLKDATLLNQPVHGSSAGSIYRVAGIGERLRLAIRVKSNELSVRVEGPLLHTEISALKTLGFQHNPSKKYLSSHFQLNGVPPERVLGVLFFHPELKFVHRISSLAELDHGA